MASYDIALPRPVAWNDRMLRRMWAGRTARDLDRIFGANMAMRTDAWHAVAPALCDDDGTHEDHDLGLHLRHAGRNVVFDPLLRAASSSRRIRDSFGQFRACLRMTERACRSHAGMARRGSYARACLTTAVLLACYLPLRLLHRARLNSETVGCIVKA